MRAGGGFNHRDSLSDAVLIKDNHVAATGIAKSIERARSSWPGRIIEVECDSIDQVVEARDAAADRVLLDNMTPEQVREAVALLEGAVEVEVSGGVTLETHRVVRRVGRRLRLGRRAHALRRRLRHRSGHAR